MKKIILTLLTVGVITTAIGAVSVNYVFDKVVASGLIDKLELEVAESVEDAVGVEVSDLSKEAETSKGEEKAIAPEKIVEISEQVSTVDKAKVVKLMTDKFSVEEIKGFSGMASGGVDSEELQDIKETLKSRVSEEEIQYLKELYKKYN